MRDVTLMMTASIDGFVDEPSGHAGGLPEPKELELWKLDRIRRAGTHIMGRVSYEQMSTVWPTATGDYAAPIAYGGGAAMFADLPDALHLELVASTTYSSGTTLRIFEPRGWGRELEENRR